MHGIMAIDQLGMDKLRAAAKIILHSDHGVQAGLRTVAVDFTAVIPVMGVLMRREGTFQPYITDVDDVRAAVNAAANDPKVRNIVMVIDSPGGSVEGLHELGQAVASAAKSKPVIAQVEGMAASAGFYIASQASKVFAGPADTVGSIGTVLVVTDMSKMAEQMGIRVVVISTGEFKGTGTPGTELTDSQEAYLQGIVDAYFADFKQAVRKGRKMSKEDVDAAADGRIFMAKDALRMGLIDGISSLEQTLSGFVDKTRARVQQQSIEILGIEKADHC